MLNRKTHAISPFSILIKPWVIRFWIRARIYIYTCTILSNLHFLTMNGFVTSRYPRHRDTTSEIIKSFEEIEKIPFTKRNPNSFLNSFLRIDLERDHVLRVTRHRCKDNSKIRGYRIFVEKKLRKSNRNETIESSEGSAATAYL